MSFRNIMLAVSSLTMLSTGLSMAQDAHVHGIASINLVIEGDELEIEFESPAANIVGFEHAAESDQDKQAIEQALKTLGNPAAMFELPESAACSLEEVEAELHGHDDEHQEAHEHEGHGHDEYDEHNEAHKDEHEGHGHDDHEGDHEVHSEFHAHYHFECEDPAKLTSIELPLFAQFPAIEEIHLQAITPRGQFGGDIEPEDAEIRLK